METNSLVPQLVNLQLVMTVLIMSEVVGKTRSNIGKNMDEEYASH